MRRMYMLLRRIVNVRLFKILHVTSDAPRLANTFKHFRTTRIAYYTLDAHHYMTVDRWSFINNVVSARCGARSSRRFLDAQHNGETEELRFGTQIVGYMSKQTITTDQTTCTNLINVFGVY